MEEWRADKNNKWYELGKTIGENPAIFVIAVIILLIAGLALIVGAFALEGLLLYTIELLLFPLLGWTTSITYFQCCAIAVATDIVVNLLKSIFKGKD